MPNPNRVSEPMDLPRKALVIECVSSGLGDLLTSDPVHIALQIQTCELSRTRANPLRIRREYSMTNMLFK